MVIITTVVIRTCCLSQYQYLVTDELKVFNDMLRVVRYNGCLVNGDSGRKRSKFVLCRRHQANGVKPSNKQFMANPKEKKVGAKFVVGRHNFVGIIPVRSMTSNLWVHRIR